MFRTSDETHQWRRTAQSLIFCLSHQSSCTAFSSPKCNNVQGSPSKIERRSLGFCTDPPCAVPVLRLSTRLCCGCGPNGCGLAGRFSLLVRNIELALTARGRQGCAMETQTPAISPAQPSSCVKKPQGACQPAKPAQPLGGERRGKERTASTKPPKPTGIHSRQRETCPFWPGFFH